MDIEKASELTSPIVQTQQPAGTHTVMNVHISLQYFKQPWFKQPTSPI